MQTQSPSIWWLRITTFALAAMAAASATYWTLKWMTPPRAEGSVAVSSFTPSNPQAVARLLGGGQISATTVSPTAAADSAARRLKLTGVLADHAIGGYALISVDGKPTQPFRVGANVNESLILHSVAPRSAALTTGMDAPPSVTLDLPKL